jgi:hypothetical protein
MFLRGGGAAPTYLQFLARAAMARSTRTSKSTDSYSIHVQPTIIVPLSEITFSIALKECDPVCNIHHNAGADALSRSSPEE